MHKPALPASEDTLLTFVSYLAQQGLTHQSIKVYLSAVRNLHVSAGLHEQFSRQLTPRLELVLKGIKKEKSKTSSPAGRLPITIEVMQKMKAVLVCSTAQYDDVLLWAAGCLAFFGFLRCGEFTVPSQSEYDPDSHLSLTDIALDNKVNPSLIQVRIKQSKTDPFRQGVDIYLGRTGKGIICPIQAIVPYLMKRGAQPGPLFILSDGSYLTRLRFASSITSVLQRVGINSKQYNTHSFRIGAATTAKEAGISDVEIKMLGRWKSSAYQLYVRTPRHKLAKLTGQMVADKESASKK